MMTSVGMKRIALAALFGGAVSLIGSVAQAQSIDVGSGTGQVGSSVPIEVTLNTGDLSVVSLQADIIFDPAVVTLSGTDACAVNPDINKTLSLFSLLPVGCSGATCTTVRAAIAGANADEIPDGSLLYTCNFDAVALGSTDLTTAMTIVADADGNETEVDGNAGSITVQEPPTPTNTPLEPTPTNTRAATNTPTSTPTNSPKPTGGGGDDDDGCQVVAPANSSAGWLLLIPAAALLWRRRRSR